MSLMYVSYVKALFIFRVLTVPVILTQDKSNQSKVQNSKPIKVSRADESERDLAGLLYVLFSPVESRVSFRRSESTDY